MGGTANMLNAFASTHDHRRPRPSDKSNNNGLIGTAAGLIDNIMTSRQTKKKLKSPKYDKRESRRPQSGFFFEEHVSQDGHRPDEHRDPDPAQKRRTMLFRFKEKIQPNANRSTGSTTRSVSRERDEQSSPPTRGRDRQPRSQQTRADRSSRLYPCSVADDVGDAEDYPLPSPPICDNDLERMLESAVEHHRREVLKCKKQLEHATRQSHTTPDDLQDLLDDMRDHDEALKNALRTLDRAQTNSAAKRHSAMPDIVPPPPADPSLEHGHDYFNHFDYASDAPRSPESRASQPIFAEFDGMHGMDPFAQSLFVQQAGTFGDRTTRSPIGELEEHLFGGAGFSSYDHHTDQQRYSVPTQRSQRYYSYPASRPRPASALFPSTGVAHRPPPTLLRSDESWRLFQKYNNYWNTIAPDDPSIPFPTRGLHAEALTGRDTLWAPDISVHPANWSEETVMQANAQAFFLGVVGLTPRYYSAPGRGRIEMGFDKRNASPEQIKALIDILKKEKMRWHSDRLGRRNNGCPGMNSSLQQDPKARAVFHAACELMSLAQELP